MTFAAIIFLAGMAGPPEPLPPRPGFSCHGTQADPFRFGRCYFGICSGDCSWPNECCDNLDRPSRQRPKENNDD